MSLMFRKDEHMNIVSYKNIYESDPMQACIVDFRQFIFAYKNIRKLKIYINFLIQDKVSFGH